MPDWFVGVNPVFAIVQNIFSGIVSGEAFKGHSMQTPTPSAPLLARTLSLVKSAPRNVTYTMMAEAIGVSVAWVSRFADDKIPDPGVKRVQRLHDYLANISSKA
jgi:lambda repressor-like predicted transcriptional regulator